MIDFIKNIIYIVQKILLFISYYSNKIFYKKYNTIDWVVGVDEMAKFISLLKGILPNSYTISFSSRAIDGVIWIIKKEGLRHVNIQIQMIWPVKKAA